jgi:hypothetical protein
VSLRLDYTFQIWYSNAVNMKIAVFWIATLCTLIVRYWHFPYEPDTSTFKGEERNSSYIFFSLKFVYYYSWCGWDLSPLDTAATTGLLYQPQMIDDDDDDCGAIVAIKIGRGIQSTRRKLAPAPLCLPQIPHDLTRAWTPAAVMGSQQLTAWAIARLWNSLIKQHKTPFQI